MTMARGTNPIAVGNRLLVCAEPSSMSVLLSGDKLEIVSRDELGEETIATPAVMDDTLYVPTAGHLWAVGK